MISIESLIPMATAMTMNLGSLFTSVTPFLNKELLPTLDGIETTESRKLFRMILLT